MIRQSVEFPPRFEAGANRHELVGRNLSHLKLSVTALQARGKIVEIEQIHNLGRRRHGAMFAGEIKSVNDTVGHYGSGLPRFSGERRRSGTVATVPYSSD
jgi:hypothetical protein